jgi:hypothetical protein
MSSEKKRHNDHRSHQDKPESAGPFVIKLN